MTNEGSFFADNIFLSLGTTQALVSTEWTSMLSLGAQAWMSSTDVRRLDTLGSPTVSPRRTPWSGSRPSTMVLFCPARPSRLSTCKMWWLLTWNTKSLRICLKSYSVTDKCPSGLLSAKMDQSLTAKQIRKTFLDFFIQKVGWVVGTCKGWHRACMKIDRKGLG